jgi:5-methylcytosine-specific restriction endonuclease McrA
MSPKFEKEPRLRLKALAYDQLRQRVLERDGWRCQACGAMTNLEVHHAEFRSQQGHDTEDNLVTLCSECHKRTHVQARGWSPLS